MTSEASAMTSGALGGDPKQWRTRAYAFIAAVLLSIVAVLAWHVAGEATIVTVSHPRGPAP